MASVSLENVSKYYETRGGVIRALEQLSFGARDGELLVLVGPSGCGKTTTLRLVAGLERPSAGLIRIADQMVNAIAPHRRGVAMVFQNYALYRHMTVRKNLTFGLKMRGASSEDIQASIQKAAGVLGIEHLLDRKPESLSGGERQRVALARAIVGNANVFLFDEPLANLDAQLRLRARAEIKLLQRRLATTMIYVTHDQEEAMSLGDRIAVLHEGRLQQCGPPLDIYNHPVKRFVGEFFGTPPMNMVRGEIVGRGPEARFVCGMGSIPIAGRSGPRSAWKEGAAVLGVRPEHVQPLLPDQAGERPDHRFSLGRGRILMMERLGDASNVHVCIGHDVCLVARVGYGFLARDLEESPWCVDLERVHWFAADPQGERLEG